MWEPIPEGPFSSFAPDPMRARDATVDKVPSREGWYFRGTLEGRLPKLRNVGSMVNFSRIHGFSTRVLPSPVDVMVEQTSFLMTRNFELGVLGSLPCRQKNVHCD